MARTNETPVSWLRRLAGILEQIIEAVEEQGGTFDHLKSFVSNPVNRRNLGKLVMGTLELVKPTQYPVTVDYRKTLEEMIAAGRYDGKNRDINSRNFSIKGEGVVNIMLELVTLTRTASTAEVEACLKENGLRAATLEELLAFGVIYPDVQRRMSVVALGSSWVFLDSSDSSCYVPYLGMDHFGRLLGLGLSDDVWGAYCYFLAVRK